MLTEIQHVSYWKQLLLEEVPHLYSVFGNPSAIGGQPPAAAQPAVSSSALAVASSGWSVGPYLVKGLEAIGTKDDVSEYIRSMFSLNLMS